MDHLTRREIIGALAALFCGVALPSIVRESFIVRPIGLRRWLTFTGNVNEGDTVTINGVTVTFASSPLDTNEILVGASAEESFLNLERLYTGLRSGRNA